MNKTKKRSIIILLVVLLAGTLFASHIMALASSDEVTTKVINSSQLISAVRNAKDGDVIGIDGNMNILAKGIKIGDPNKHVTLKRMNSSSSFIVNSEVTFENITFDGAGIEASNSYISTTGNVTFQDVTFINSINLEGNGGAISFDGGVVFVDNCTFENNSAYEGGHLYVSESSKVTIENSTFKTGHAFYSGGAIKNNAHGQRIMTLRNSIIKDNSSDNYGGGISINGYIVVYDTKIYDNSAINGGADIGKTVFGMFSMYPYNDMDELSALYEEDGIVPIRWVNDYDFEASINITDVYPELANSLLKLVYEIPPTEVTLSPSSLGTASDGKVIGLESGKYYKITSNDVVRYFKADGSLTATESEASPLVGTEIIGLTNGETYLVEEFTPAPTTVMLDSASLGIADNEKIIGLSAGKIYKVSVDGTTNYTKADGTLTSNEAEVTELEGTEIVGLVNGVTYLVDEYIPPVEEEPTDPTDPDPEIPDEEDPTDSGTDEDPIQGSNTTTTTNSNNTSNTTNNTTNNSTAHNSDSRDDSSTVNNRDESSTVNNYSYDYSNNTKTESSVLPSNDDIGEKGGQASANQHQTITVDYGDIADAMNVQEDGKNITINVNVNVDTKEKEEAEPQALEVVSSNVESEQPTSISNISWVDLVKICLLFGIFICVFRRPVSK